MVPMATYSGERMPRYVFEVACTLPEGNDLMRVEGQIIVGSLVHSLEETLNVLGYRAHSLSADEPFEHVTTEGGIHLDAD
jgi:hypothetical protein